jgi:hypothetical protein
LGFFGKNYLNIKNENENENENENVIFADIQKINLLKKQVLQ